MTVNCNNSHYTTTAVRLLLMNMHAIVDQLPDLGYRL